MLGVLDSLKMMGLLVALFGLTALINWLTGLSPIAIFFALGGIACWVVFVISRRAMKAMLPRCAQGRCDWQAYASKEETIDGKHFECRCGNRYLLHGNDFMRIESSGATTPFMTWRRGRWMSASSVEKRRSDHVSNGV